MSLSSFSISVAGVANWKYDLPVNKMLWCYHWPACIKKHVIMFSWSVRARNFICLQWPKLVHCIFFIWQSIELQKRCLFGQRCRQHTPPHMDIIRPAAYVCCKCLCRSCTHRSPVLLERHIFLNCCYQLPFYNRAATFCSCNHILIIPHTVLNKTGHRTSPPLHSWCSNTSVHVTDNADLG